MAGTPGPPTCGTPGLQHDGACCVIQGQRQQFAFASAELDDGHQ